MNSVTQLFHWRMSCANVWKWNSDFLIYVFFPTSQMVNFQIIYHFSLVKTDGRAGVQIRIDFSSNLVGSWEVILDSLGKGC